MVSRNRPAVRRRRRHRGRPENGALRRADTSISAPPSQISLADELEADEVSRGSAWCGHDDERWRSDCILYRLQATEIDVGNASKKWVAIVQPVTHIYLDQSSVASGIKRERRFTEVVLSNRPLFWTRKGSKSLSRSSRDCQIKPTCWNCATLAWISDVPAKKHRPSFWRFCYSGEPWKNINFSGLFSAVADLVVM